VHVFILFYQKMHLFCNFDKYLVDLSKDIVVMTHDVTSTHIHRGLITFTKSVKCTHKTPNSPLYYCKYVENNLLNISGKFHMRNLNHIEKNLIFVKIDPYHESTHIVTTRVPRKIVI
jgi:hypothetical protein